MRASFLVPLLPLLILKGCAWRTAGAEHYIGPVLFRYAQPPEGRAYVGQVVNLLMSVEGGTQWGLTLGPSGRTTAAPRHLASENRDVSRPAMRWEKPLSPWGSPASGSWTLSLFYLRGDRIPQSRLTRRWHYGAAIHFGHEARAVTIGASSRTSVHPPYNAITVLRYDGAPLETRFTSWSTAPEASLPAPTVLEEMSP